MNRTILIVAPWLPLPADFGGALRTFHLIRELSKHRHVTLIAPATHTDLRYVAELAEYCDVTAVPAGWTPRHPAGLRKRLGQLVSIPGSRSFLESSTYSPQFQQVINRLFLTRQIDLVQFEFTHTGVYSLPRPVPVVIDAHNIEHELLYRVAETSTSRIVRLFKSREAAKIAALERRIWASATVCVATSSRDALNIERASGTPTMVVPNGVDIARFARPADHDVREPNIVFTGVMRHQPNVDAVRWFVSRVLPRIRESIPDVRFTIVGSNPPPDILEMEHGSIHVTGHVADVRPYLHRASVAVAPLLSGGGTRLKILEAFAASTPVVATSLGAEGLDVSDFTHLRIADTPESFAAAVVETISNRSDTRARTERALALARERYDWTAVASTLINVHAAAIDRFTRISTDVSPVYHDT